MRFSLCWFTWLLISSQCVVGAEPVWFFPEVDRETRTEVVTLYGVDDLGRVDTNAKQLALHVSNQDRGKSLAPLGKWEGIECLSIEVRFQVGGAGLKELVNSIEIPSRVARLTVDIWGELPLHLCKAIGALKSLTFLSLVCASTPPECVALLETLQTLRHLRFSCFDVASSSSPASVDGGFGYVGCSAVLRSISKLRALESLSIEMRHIPSIDFVPVASLPALTALRSPSLTDDSLGVLAAKGTSIRTLDLSRSGLMFDSAPSVSDLGIPLLALMPQLESLSLAECPNVGDLGVVKLPTIARLKRLSLDACESPQYPKHMAHLRREVFASQDYRVSRFDAIASLQGLTHLSLRGIVTLTDEEVARLGKRLPNLICLDLRNCVNVNKSGIAALAAFTKLRELYCGLDRSAGMLPPDEPDLDAKCFGLVLALPELEVFWAPLIGQKLKSPPPVPERGWAKLRAISLSGWGIPDGELGAFVQSASSATVLDISFTLTGAATVAALCTRPTLAELRADGCTGMTSKDVRSICASASLTVLSIANNSWVNNDLLDQLASVEKPPKILVLSRYAVRDESIAAYVKKTRLRVIER